jgi:tRNA dimethylallyltransferase
MFRRGLVAETQALLARGLSANPTASQALGYRQALEHLQGLRSLPDTIALVKIRTWQFAKRQRTWFRRQFALRWIRPGPEAPLAVIADRLAHEWAQRRAVC